MIFNIDFYCCFIIVFLRESLYETLTFNFKLLIVYFQTKCLVTPCFSYDCDNTRGPARKSNIITAEVKVSSLVVYNTYISIKYIPSFKQQVEFYQKEPKLNITLQCKLPYSQFFGQMSSLVITSFVIQEKNRQKCIFKVTLPKAM